MYYQRYYQKSTLKQAAEEKENHSMGKAFGFVTIGIPAAILMTMLLMMQLVVR